MDQRPKSPSDPQILVLLRGIVGAYLLYLAWDLHNSARGIVYLLFMAVFALAGATLLFLSVRKLLRGDYLVPGADGKPLIKPGGIQGAHSADEADGANRTCESDVTQDAHETQD